VFDIECNSPGEAACSRSHWNQPSCRTDYLSMHTNDRRITISVLATVAVLALAGCGSGDSDAGTLTDDEFLGHQLRNVAADGSPAVDFDIEADEHGGWNIHINADGFEFTPADVNGAAVGGHGHAHVYVDGTKFSRVYSEWFYLPASAMPEGEHTVMITLNADDHSAWAVDGEAVTAAATVTAAAADAAGHGDHTHGEEMDDLDEESASEDAASGSETAADHRYTFAIADGTADPQLEQHSVERGSVVRIEVTSDVADELHLHGYDVSADVAPGEVAVLEFTADMVGRFALETHETALTLLDLLVE